MFNEGLAYGVVSSRRDSFSDADVLGRRTLLESPIPRHEYLQHVRDQRRGINHLAVSLRMQCRIAFEVGLQADRAHKGQLRTFRLGQRPESQFLYRRAHRERPL